MKKKLLELDEETGILSDVSEDYVEIKPGDRIIRAGALEYLAEKAKRYEDKTDFVWAMFKYNSPLHPNIKSSNLTRLMCFATFCGSDGFVMKKADIRGMLRIDANMLADFLTELSDAGIITNKGEMLYLNPIMFARGELESDIDYIRLFTDATREIYSGCSSTSAHKSLSYIFKMISFVNRPTNILSYNQEEQDINHVQYMAFTDFCTAVGYNATHAARLRKDLLQHRINGELAVGFFNELSQLCSNGKYVVVNPKLFFGGLRNTTTYNAICSLFAEEKHNYFQVQ